MSVKGKENYMASGTGRIDLHLHTNISDGTDTPEELLKNIRKADLTVFSVTDHDSFKGAVSISAMLCGEDPVFITGVEFSCKDEEGKYHILGYGFAAIAGIMVGILYNSITPALGEVPSYKMLAIIVLGGLGNPVGTVIAGLLIGFVEVFVSAYTNLPIPKDAIAFVVLIIMLLIKPEGLMGQKNKM